MPHNTPSPPPTTAAEACCRHREEVDAVNDILRGYGISYPLGARGVRELAGQARHFRKKARGLEADCARLEEEKVAREQKLVDAHRATIGELRAAETRGQAAEKDRALTQALAEVAAARKFAAEMRDFCSPHGVAVDYAERLEQAMDRAKDGGR
ncbi:MULTISPECIES: hypothetical protein [unclassified Streptomyces]|uniref:hypothetical protein n=1 Tax=unclassified Streptomyces TaxID=2593676 RepID=UPI001F299918|nr:MULTISPECIES: hypothetical protein [unclassified Streptomyces]MCF0086665.1 hypothetical protein [Streptomyces sp. MH192]MCF0098819.1 hypothetical protein [Streptomyces sp. MH191]